MSNAYNRKGISGNEAHFSSIYSTTKGDKPKKSPRSQIAGSHNKTSIMTGQHAFTQSQLSVDSDNNINAFLLKDQCGQIVKTKKVLEREQDRIEKVKRAREKAIDIAMEKTAKLILNERRYESNAKRHEKHLEDESLYRKDHYEQLKEKRTERRQYVKDHEHKLSQKGYERYKKDHRANEERIEKTQANEKQRVEDMFMNQKKQMAITEKKEKDWVE